LAVENATPTSGNATVSQIQTLPREINTHTTEPVFPSAEQQVTYTLVVNVLDSNKNRISEAEVSINSLNLTQLTTEAGTVVFTNLSAGNYQISIKKGDLTANTQVNINDPAVGTYEITVELSEKATLLNNPVFQEITGVTALVLVGIFIFKKVVLKK